MRCSINSPQRVEFLQLINKLLPIKQTLLRINMKRLIGIYCIAALGAQCILGASLAPFIVGGEPAERGQFPYLVQVTYYTLHVCGGAILNENWILTTARCVGEPDMDQYEVVANQYNIHQNEGSERRHNVSQIILLPSYLPGFNKYDLALVKLSQPLTLDTYVQPIALPPTNHTPENGVNCTVSGWGTQSIIGRDESILRFVQVPFMDMDSCDEKISSVSPGNRVWAGEVCAGNTGSGICIGDTGGPLVANDLPNRTPYLVGIAAWLVRCGEPNVPEVYTNVSYYLDWINETIENN